MAISQWRKEGSVVFIIPKIGRKPMKPETVMTPGLITNYYFDSYIPK
ncbi:MAG: hypothetical protein LBI48_05020 [Burkholderiaceae bacterium]|nr:hypothetical protein [Burkholderiaceae bacterium]